MAYDVRAIANLVLDQAEDRGITLSNFSLNKVLFFVHGHFIAHFRYPLIREPVEAWEHGPVYREIFRQFKSFERNPISARAVRLDYATGTYVPYNERPTQEEISHISPVIDFYIRVPAPKLYSISHTQGGPWYEVWNHQSLSNPGMIISDSLIEKYFRTMVAT